MRFWNQSKAKNMANEKAQLDRRRVAVTRARHQAAPLEALIRDFGGEPIAFPCIAIAPPLDLRPLQACLRRLAKFDWLLLTSANAARAIADCLADLRPGLADAKLEVAAAGPATAAEARALLSMDVQYVPAEYGAGQLAGSLPLRPSSRILLPQSDIADPSTAEVLRSRGAQVTAVVAYRTIMGEGGADLAGMISRGEIDALSFTSPSAVAFFRRRCPLDEALRLPALCIGPATAAAAREQGFQEVVTPGHPGLPDMAVALADYFAASTSPG